MIREESEEFLPLTFRYCWMGWMELSSTTVFQFPIWEEVQSP